jgi:thymidylate synthase (FAD)
MGTDTLVVNAARVSFSKEASNYTEEQNVKLIRYLATHQHFTPFTHPQIVLREKVPIFVARQRFKHTVGFSYNEESRRYVSDDPDFFMPDGWRKAAENKKQGSSEELIKAEEVDLDGMYAELVTHASTLYKAMITYGVAPEQARMVLPQSMFTEYYVTGSLAAFARAYRLRKDPHAQREIQDLAVRWDEVIRPLFPVSWSALVD